MIILSCGHREDDFDKHHHVTVKSWSREWTKALAYKTVCQACRDEYAARGELFEDEKDATHWLTDPNNEY